MGCHEQDGGVIQLNGPVYWSPLYIGIAYVLPQVHPTSTDILSFLRDIGQAMSFFHVRYGSFQLLHLSELLRDRKKKKYSFYDTTLIATALDLGIAFCS